MGQKDASPHHGQIVEVEQRDRFAVIKKDKVGLHKQIHRQAAADKGHKAIDRDSSAQHVAGNAPCPARGFAPAARRAMLRIMFQCSPRCSDMSTKPQ